MARPHGLARLATADRTAVSRRKGGLLLESKKMPALIIKAPFVSAIFDGATVGKRTVRKTVECRGARCITIYRGAVAIFVSNSYAKDDEEHIVAWRKSLGRCSREQEIATRAACQAWHAKRYCLAGFVKLTGCVNPDDLPLTWRREATLEKLSRRATAQRGEVWSVGSFLEIEPIHECTEAYTPRFDACCVGCQASPPHNGTACHVNWQTVTVPPEFMPSAAEKEIKPWPVK